MESKTQHLLLQFSGLPRPGFGGVGQTEVRGNGGEPNQGLYKDRGKAKE